MTAKLFVVPNVVYPAFDGGRKLTLGRIMELVKENFKITVIAFNYQQENSDDARAFFKRHDVKFLCYELTNKKNNFLFDCLILMTSTKPISCQKINREDAFFSFLHEHLKVNRYNCVSVESIIFEGALSIFERSSIDKIEVVFHNVESDFLRSLSLSAKNIAKLLAYYIESKKMAWLEGQLDKRVRLDLYTLVFLTKCDLENYRNKGLFLKSKYILNCNKLYLSSSLTRKVNKKSPFFLFPGSLQFSLNREGILWLLDYYENDASINVKIIITGTVNEKDRLMFRQYKKIELLGFVSEERLFELYSTCLAIISPIISGSGVKIKNLEALAYEIPIIMTEFSSIGLNYQNYSSVVSENDQKDFISKMKLISINSLTSEDSSFG